MAARGLQRASPRRQFSTALEWSARGGYAARAVVYLGLGALILLAALDLTPRAQGARGLLATWAQWPLGLGLIAAVGCGLLGFAAWRGLQSLLDADGHGVSPKAIAVRIGQAVSGVIYASLALSAFELLDLFEDFGEADETETPQQIAAQFLAMPHGDIVLMLAGAAMIAVGLGNVIQGLMQDFGKRLACSERICRRVVILGRIGYCARGLATLPAGFFIMRAGLETQSSQVRSWAGALQIIEGRPAGSWLLGAIAVGLLAFGAFGLIEAAFRRINPAA
ncbi:MAG: DUF1206 domain-containing protein [Caulobacter sp.]